jgi:site-specific recombinase XerC
VKLTDVNVQVMRRLQHAGRLSQQSEPRVFGLIERFTTFVQRAYGVERLERVTPAHVEAFVQSSTVRDGAVPSVATMRLRRSTVRLFFRTARDLGFIAGDPTLDVVLPSRTNRAARPLSDEEVQRCRRAALHDLTSTRLSVPWALGEATARTAEIPRLTVSDLDLANGRVWIHGSHNTEARWAILTSWGLSQVVRRVSELGRDPDPAVPLAKSGFGNAESHRAYSSQALRETITRAGLGDKAEVQPASLTAWAGVQVLTRTGRIDAVAGALGMRSLDAAARAIDWNWRDPDQDPADG